MSPRLDYSPCHLPSTPPPCCKALLLRCGTLKTHTVHSGPAMADLLCSCAVFHFILQLAGMPLQEDTAKSPKVRPHSHTTDNNAYTSCPPLCSASLRPHPPGISGNFTLVSLRLQAASSRRPPPPSSPLDCCVLFSPVLLLPTFCASLLSLTSP